jgi:hypothetical protein
MHCMAVKHWFNILSYSTPNAVTHTFVLEEHTNDDHSLHVKNASLFIWTKVEAAIPVYSTHSRIYIVFIAPILIFISYL